jgi:hypothetical protein
MPFRRLVPLVLLPILALTACDPAATATGPEATTTASAPPLASPTNAAHLPDPLVPYSPAPRDLEPTTEGFAGDTLTLPTSDGGTLRVRLDSSALRKDFEGDLRAFSVWLTVENPDGEPWTGEPGAAMTITDPAGVVYEPIPSPTDADLHPTPEVYGMSNADLTAPTTIDPGGIVQGVTVFRMPGGFRPIVVRLTLDGGVTWGAWETSFGPY